MTTHDEIQKKHDYLLTELERLVNTHARVQLAMLEKYAPNEREIPDISEADQRHLDALACEIDVLRADLIPLSDYLNDYQRWDRGLRLVRPEEPNSLI